jgi:hypothetical protein
MIKKLFTLLLSCYITLALPAQDATAVHNPNNYTVKAKSTAAKIVIDGALTEPVWATTPAQPGNMHKKFPTNNGYANDSTEIKIVYDNNFIYFGVKLYDSVGKFYVNSLKRDQGLRKGDGFEVILDPQNQQANAVMFAVSPFNTQSEDVFSAGNYDLTYSWDNTWYSQTKIHQGYWVLEMAIPFNILRYDANKQTWGINFIRSIRRTNEFQTWTLMPLQFRGIDLGYLGQLQFDTPPPHAGTNISLSPYALTSGTTQQGAKSAATANAGLDAKIAVTTGLNLDLTLNPDFSQVDVDQQVTNLSRFSIFFPERRTFFLENSDLYTDYGIPPIRPFYSRRIGSKNGQAVPILFGARLSGNIAKKTRIGLMNITTGQKNQQSGDNFTAFSINQRVLERSTVAAYFLNRVDLDNADTKISPDKKYSRNAGVQLGYSNKDGTWNGWYGQHLSIKPNINSKNNYINFGGEYQGEHLNVVLDFNDIGKNYYVDMGFENVIENYDAQRDTSIRLGAQFVYNSVKYTWFGNTKQKWNRISIEAENFYQQTPDGNPYETSTELNFDYSTKNAANFKINFERTKSFLRFPFKFVDDGGALPLPAANYDYSTIGAEYNSDGRKDQQFNIGFDIGKFYNANYTQLRTSVVLRKQPKYTFQIRAEVNKLDFPSGYGSETITLIAPQFEYNFSNKLFWTTFVQLNSQNNNLNINSRLQYRFKPMSDFFVVYTDNYFSDPLFKNKNRGLVLKLNYWLNL